MRGRDWLLCVALLWSGSGRCDATGWEYFGNTQSGLRYSPLDQINRTNVSGIEVAWTYRTGELDRLGPERSGEQSFENTPIIVDGLLIVCTPTARVIALDPATGTERWVFDPNNYPLPRDIHFPKCRGVSPWLDPLAAPGAPCRRRLLYGTWDFTIYAIDAAIGKRCMGFGDAGAVHPDPGKPLARGEFLAIPSPPAIVGDVAIFGSMVLDNLRTDAPSGKVRAYDARTGAPRWEFDPIPRDPRDPAAAGWLGDSARVTGHANVWAPMSVDEVRGLVYLPTTSPSVDFYGGTRHGDNRYANSLVALHGETGELAWHQQIVHHDIWDYDLPAQPILVDLKKDGRDIPAVVLLTKQGLVFIFDRVTGEPFFPLEERPVPDGAVMGEWLSPTQPFPTRPPPLVDPGLSPDDAWGFTFVDRYLCRRRIEALRHGPLYTPLGEQGTILMPGFAGGVNWGGGAVDPARKVLFVSTLHIAGIAKLVARTDDPAQDEAPADIDVRHVIRFPQLGTPYAVEAWLLFSPFGAPCTQPPWSRLSAVDLERGTILWQVPLGTLEKMLPLPLPLEMGPPHAGGAIVTAGGVVFIAASADDKFRAYDAADGRVLWQAELPAGGQAIPMTYAVNDRQYVVIAAGGHFLYRTTPGDYVIAYALPAGGS
jgi:quinoprotein glucose dehydrogenase